MQKIFISKRLELENGSGVSQRALTDVGFNLRRLEAEDTGPLLAGRPLKASLSLSRAALPTAAGMSKDANGVANSLEAAAEAVRSIRQ